MNTALDNIFWFVIAFVVCTLCLSGCAHFEGGYYTETHYYCPFSR